MICGKDYSNQLPRSPLTTLKKVSLLLPLDSQHENMADHHLPDYKVTQRFVSTLVLSHNSSRYVDLEQLEFLLTPQERICLPLARKDESTRLTLPFLELDAYHTARRTWESRSDMLFVIEDESCFSGKGVRSMYKYVTAVATSTYLLIRLLQIPIAQFRGRVSDGNHRRHACTQYIRGLGFSSTIPQLCRREPAERCRTPTAIATPG